MTLNEYYKKYLSLNNELKKSLKFKKVLLNNLDFPVNSEDIVK